MSDASHALADAGRAYRGLDVVTIATAGGRKVGGELARPSAKGPALLLLHEWWGLDPQTKAFATEFAELGYLSLTCDLYGGRSTSDYDQASALMEGLDLAAVDDILVSWAGWLRRHPLGNEKLATIGWCMGGRFSVSCSVATPVDATVVYYGRVNHSATELANLKGPVLGHFAEKDPWYNHATVDPFETTMKRLGKSLELYWYDADHAFAGPTSETYDEGAAQLAWERTLKFLSANLRAT